MASLYGVAVSKRRTKKKEDAKSGGSKKKASGLIRVQKDLDELELPYNVRLDLPDAKNIGMFYLKITPDSGYWKGATYSFKFMMPSEYPIKPPKVTCEEKCYHPNIDLAGNVCLNLLKSDWRPILSVQQEPNPADPLNLEAAEIFRRSESEFRALVEKSLRGGYVGGATFPAMTMTRY